MLKLGDQVTYSDRIQPVQLPPAGPAPTVIGDDANMYVAGFGRMVNGKLPSRLQIVSVPAQSRERCQQFYGPRFNFTVTVNQMCAGYDDQKTGTYLGDSGSVLIAASDGNAYGITSYSPSDNYGPKLYTFIPSVVEWIGQQMKN